MTDVTLWHGDCLDLMGQIPDGSVDMVAADLPYGTTACRWDQVIPFEPLWAHYKRIIKPRGAIVLTASQPFTSALVMSNPQWFRYEWIWEKNNGSGHLDASRRPLKCHENIPVFASGQTFYSPQMSKGKPYGGFRCESSGTTEVYGRQVSMHQANDGKRSPRSVLYFPVEQSSLHPTQKPVALFEYLIKTYTNDGETVLDNTMGSGTAAVACVRTGRKFIGIEKDADYFAIAQKRIAAEQAKTALLTGVAS